MNNTKGVRPFYIKYESWMTDEQVAEALDKAVAAGARLLEGVGCFHDDSFRLYTPNHWGCFGVDNRNFTVFYDRGAFFGEDAVQITLDQLDEHLGIVKTPKEETTMELRNVKIDLRKEDGSVDEELSRAFREAVLESGGKWYGAVEMGSYMDSKFLYVDEEGDLRFGGSEKWFNDQAEQEITFEYERKLTWSAKPKEIVKETVEICGVKYYKEDVDDMLATLKPVV